MRAVTVLLIVGIAGVSCSLEAAPVKSPYVDLGNYSKETSDFPEIARAIGKSFSRECAKRACTNSLGEYRPVNFRCSADMRSGEIAVCHWVFVAMQLEMTPATGATHGAATTYDCVLPGLTRVGAVELATGLRSHDPLHVPLPGINKSLWSLSRDCVPGRLG